MDAYAICRLVRYLPMLRSLPQDAQLAAASLRARLQKALAGEEVPLRALALWEELKEELACLGREERAELGQEWASDLLVLVGHITGAAAWLEEEPAAEEAAVRVAAACEQATQGLPLGAAILGTWSFLRYLLKEAEVAAQRASPG